MSLRQEVDGVFYKQKKKSPIVESIDLYNQVPLKTYRKSQQGKMVGFDSFEGTQEGRKGSEIPKVERTKQYEWRKKTMK